MYAALGGERKPASVQSTDTLRVVDVTGERPLDASYVGLALPSVRRGSNDLTWQDKGPPAWANWRAFQRDEQRGLVASEYTCYTDVEIMGQIEQLGPVRNTEPDRFCPRTGCAYTWACDPRR